MGELAGFLIDRAMNNQHVGKTREGHTHTLGQMYGCSLEGQAYLLCLNPGVAHILYQMQLFLAGRIRLFLEVFGPGSLCHDSAAAFLRL